MTWTEEEVSKKERITGELIAQLKVLKQEATYTAAECARNKGAVAIMGAMYPELQEVKAACERGPRGGAREDSRRSLAGF